ncbi:MULTISPECIES: hypothetical protein [Microbacterium]|uniref:hypothetical protein n=1 Tax=Microbacterium TaxID=33882 RepID=UPI000D64D2A9|nr:MULTISPECIES: hypothetical protein [Microbacterium]
MDPTPSSAPETTAPLTRRTNPALTRRFSRRASTFALGGLVAEPARSEPPAEEDEASSTSPGRSGSAPGQTKDPKKP